MEEDGVGCGGNGNKRGVMQPEVVSGDFSMDGMDWREMEEDETFLGCKWWCVEALFFFSLWLFVVSFIEGI